MATKEKRVQMRIEKVPGLMMDDVIIGINGVNYQIPRGQTVEVPDFVKEEYDRSVKAQEQLFETENSRKYPADNGQVGAAVD